MQAMACIDDGCTIGVSPYMALVFEASKVNTDRWYSHRPPEIDISEFSRLDAKDNELSLSAVPIHGILWFDVVPVMLGPNITGKTGSAKLQNGPAEYTKGDGAFRRSGGSIESGDGAQWTGICWDFDASWSSSTFGTSQTVQPTSLCLMPCIKF